MREAIHFPPQLQFVVFPERQSLDAIAIVVRFALTRIGVAQLVLDDAELLAEVALAIATIDRCLDLPLQLAIDSRFAEVALDPVDEELDALDRIDCLEKKLFFFEREVDERRQQIRECIRPFRDVHSQDVQQLVRILRIALDQLFEERHRLVHQMLGLGRLGNRTRRDLPQFSFEVRLALQHLHELDALPALEEQLISIGRQRQPLNDRRQHADLRQILSPRILFVAALLAERRDQILVLGEALQQPDIAIDSNLQRKHAAGEKH